MLPDNLRKNKSNGERGREQGRVQRGRGRGQRGSFSYRRTENMLRKWPHRVNAGPSSYTIAKYFHQPFGRTRDFAWQRDLIKDSLTAGGLDGIETGTKLYVSNLDHGVTSEDLRELFSGFGTLKRYAVHFDRNGHPQGSAEVVFARRSEALAAIKRYNNVPLDGKPMTIEIIGTNFEMPVSARVNVIRGANGRGRRTVVLMPEVGRSGGSVEANRHSERWYRQDFGRGRGRGHGHGRGRGRGRGRGHGSRGKHPAEKPAGELDK